MPWAMLIVWAMLMPWAMIIPWAKLSCWEPASLSGSSLHTSSPHACTSWLLVHSVYLSDVPAYSGEQSSFTIIAINDVCVLAGPWPKSNPVSTCAKLCCWEPASLIGSSLHTSLSLCTLYTSPEVPAQCTLWRKAVIHYHCYTWCVSLLVSIQRPWSL